MAQKPTATRLLFKELKRFLASTDPEVLCIRGLWGVGKTYAWEHYLKQARTIGGIALKEYAYVSLFGVQTLDKLKYAIFENTVPTSKIGTEPNIETLYNRANATLDSAGRKYWHTFMQLIGFKGAADVLEGLSFLSIKDQIICIDDLERRGKDLRIIDVLGLISMLALRRKCKVVLILNDQELETADKDVLLKYQEKVIDASLLFAPTAEECADIALGNSKIEKMLAQCCVTLGINNIRIIKKIERLAIAVQPLLRHFDGKLLELAIQTLTLFGWAHFSGPESDKNNIIDFAIKKRGRGWYGSSDKNKLTADEEQWDALLDTYGFKVTDDFDLALLDGIRAGFFDEERIKREAAKVNEAIKADSATSEAEDAWEAYRNTFNDNSNEVIEKLTKSHLKHPSAITVSGLSSVISVLKELGANREATAVLQAYMEANKDQPQSLFDVPNQPFPIESQDVIDAFNAKAATFVDDRDPGEVLREIGEKRDWGKADFEILKKLSVDEFRKIFKSKNGKALRYVVRGALNFKSVSGDPEYRQIANRAIDAMKLIGAESSINRVRIERLLNIKLPKT